MHTGCENDATRAKTAKGETRAKRTHTTRPHPERRGRVGPRTRNAHRGHTTSADATRRAAYARTQQSGTHTTTTTRHHKNTKGAMRHTTAEQRRTKLATARHDTTRAYQANHNIAPAYQADHNTAPHDTAPVYQVDYSTTQHNTAPAYQADTSTVGSPEPNTGTEAARAASGTHANVSRSLGVNRCCARCMGHTAEGATTTPLRNLGTRGNRSPREKDTPSVR